MILHVLFKQSDYQTIIYNPYVCLIFDSDRNKLHPFKELELIKPQEMLTYLWLVLVLHHPINIQSNP
jgi:hypothetical protein